MPEATPGFKQSAIWKSLRAVKRRLAPPGPAPRHEGTLVLAELPAVLEVAQTFRVRVTVTNTGPDAWPARGPGTVQLVARWLTNAGESFGEPARLPLSGPAYPGEPRTVELGLTAPGFVGDFTLEITTSAPGPRLDRAAVPVVCRRAADINYHDVYRTADLHQNHWWVVGGYYSREQYEESTRSRREMLETHAGLTPDSRVLDVGCGTGQVGDSLQDYLSETGAYYGCDIGAEAIEFCRERFNRPNFRFAQNGMMEIPFTDSDGPFDLAIYFSVFTHTFIDESVRLLGETRRLLASNGVVVVDVITSPLVERGLGNRGEMVINAAHFEALARVVGFAPAVIGRWPWNPHAERLMYVLRREPNS